MTGGFDDLTATAIEPSRRSRRWWWGVAAGLSAVVVFVIVWFQPQKLFIDERVNEAIPTAGSPSTTGIDPVSTTSPTAAIDPMQLARGEFVSLDHSTSGISRVLELSNGHRVVRLEGLDTSNGPDLYLYLSSNLARGEEAAFDDDYVSLGRLKGNQGDQNYDIPPGADLARHGTVVIWCDRFNSAFGAADLVPT